MTNRVSEYEASVKLGIVVRNKLITKKISINDFESYCNQRI